MFLVNNVYYSMTKTFFDFNLLESASEGAPYILDTIKNCNPLVYLTFKFLPNINPILMIIINYIVFGSISYLITYLIRKTKFKFIIGE